MTGGRVTGNDDGDRDDDREDAAAAWWEQVDSILMKATWRPLWLSVAAAASLSSPPHSARLLRKGPPRLPWRRRSEGFGSFEWLIGGSSRENKAPGGALGAHEKREL